MSLTSEVADVRVPDADEIQKVIFRLGISIRSAQRFLSPKALKSGCLMSTLAGASDDLQKALEQFELLQSWAYNECVIGD